MQEEVKAASNALGQLGGRLEGVHEVASISEGAGGGRRTAVVVSKARPTPVKFPRKPGLPAKRPL
jgi:16S rRNA (guanine527-N7)-methyltransferase